MAEKTSTTKVPAVDGSGGDNQVFLRGRLAAEPVLRSLPSGDELCAFRLTVARPPDGRVRVDSLDCASILARVRRTLERASPGDELRRARLSSRRRSDA